MAADRDASGLDLSLSLSLPPHIYLFGTLVIPSAVAAPAKETSGARKRKSVGKTKRRRPPLMTVTEDGALVKDLTASDLGSLSRLMLSKGYVKEHVLRYLSPTESRKVESVNGGLSVRVWDRDANRQHWLTLSHWSSSDSYVLNGDWIRDFAKRKRLQVNQRIRLFWDHVSYTFHFEVVS